MVASTLINSVSDLLGWGQITSITDDSEPTTRKVVRALNTVLLAMQNDKEWAELSTESIISIPAPTSESNIANVTKGSAAVTLAPSSTMTFSAGDVGKFLQIGTGPAVKISTRVGAREVTLESVWTGDTATLQDIKMFSLSYVLPADFDRILDAGIRILDTGKDVEEITASELRQNLRDNGISYLSGDPEHFAVFGNDPATGRPYVTFDSVFNVARTLRLSYQKKHPTITIGTGATDIVIQYPDRYVLYIIDQTVAKLARDVENSMQVQQQAADALKEAVRVNSNKSNSQERVRMRVEGLRHGAYRRR